MEEILRQAISLGISGLLFVMWWHERAERIQTGNGLADAARDKTALTDVTANLVGVIRSNTEMLSALREELRSHRQSEAQWLGAIFERLDHIRDE